MIKKIVAIFLSIYFSSSAFSNDSFIDLDAHERIVTITSFCSGIYSAGNEDDFRFFTRIYEADIKSLERVREKHREHLRGSLSESDISQLVLYGSANGSISSAYLIEEIKGLEIEDARSKMREEVEFCREILSELQEIL